MMAYEAIFDKLLELAPSKSQDERNVEWLSSARTVGLARNTGGQIEIFLQGAELEAKSQTVRRALEYQTWHRAHNQPDIDANRLLLPAAGHFDQVAAFICAELLRSGSDSELANSFSKTEPLIELAIARLRLTDQAALGLRGELLLLDALLRHASVGCIEQVLMSWAGWRVSSRDFIFDSLGIEVKTTTRETSSHLVEGVHQVEPALENREDELLLVSIGLEWVEGEQENSTTLPAVVDSILRRIEQSMDGSEFIDTFLLQVREYGADQDVGYDHRTMSNRQAFTRPFVTRFVRGYDMLDDNIEVLHSKDLDAFPHIDPRSVKFRILLPHHVSGDLNPTVGLNATAIEILKRLGS